MKLFILPCFLLLSIQVRLMGLFVCVLENSRIDPQVNHPHPEPAHRHRLLLLAVIMEDRSLMGLF